MVPAKDVGGDFYDFFRIDDDHIGFIIADVSGKGIPAAIYMAVSRTLIRATGIRGGACADCITYSNRLLASESVDCMFVTAFYGIYNLKTGEMSYCNAGHNPPYLLKANGQVQQLPLSVDPILGAIDGLEFHEAKLQIEKDDALVLYTDGVTEAMDPSFQEYGEDRLQHALSGVENRSCQQLIDIIKADMATFVGEAEQSDDTTLLVIKRKA